MSATGVAVARASSRPDGDTGLPLATGQLARFAVGPVAAVAVAMVMVELAVASRYGIHRDELYFIACARHLAWGYVDQPPFVPTVARVETALFGTSAFALRVLPALSGAIAVICTALMARELGGGRRAQGLAALAAACSAEVLAAVHLLSTTTFDITFWAAITLVVLRILRTGASRLWLVAGALLGVALLNKYNVLALVGGLVVGVVMTGRKDVLGDRWLHAGVVLAVVIFAPNILWNAQHDWASLAMLHSLHSENGGLGASMSFAPSQLIVVGPVLAPLWIGGLRRLWRPGFAKPVAVAYVTMLVAFTLTGGKSYYLAGAYFVLFAAGSVSVEERLSAREIAHWPRARMAAIIAGALVALPLTLPVLPVSTLAKGQWESKINKDLSATVGWDQMVRQVAGVVDSLPPQERAHVVIFTGDYGMAGAVDLYGPRYGLPQAISGHNSFWWWGPKGARNGATTVAVNLDASYLRTIFADVTPAGTVASVDGVWTEERGDPIYICRHQVVSWAKAWPAARNYG